MLVCLRLAVPIGLSPLHIPTLCGSERVLLVSTEPLDDLSCLTTPGVGRPGDGAVARAVGVLGGGGARFAKKGGTPPPHVGVSSPTEKDFRDVDGLTRRMGRFVWGWTCKWGRPRRAWRPGGPHLRKSLVHQGLVPPPPPPPRLTHTLGAAKTRGKAQEKRLEDTPPEPPGSPGNQPTHLLTSETKIFLKTKMKPVEGATNWRQIGGPNLCFCL